MFYFNTLCCYHKISLTECIKCERTNAEKNKEERRVFVCAYVCVVFEKACELGREGQRLNRKECV